MITKLFSFTQIFRFLFTLSVSFLLQMPAMAHPLAPGLLALTEVEENQFQSIWKLPNKTANDNRLSPQFPNTCTMQDIQQPVSVGTGRSQSFKLSCSESILQHRFGVNGMTASTSGVLLRITLLDDRVVHQMLNAENNIFIIPSKQTISSIFFRYISLGAEHLIQGIDHVLFVITLAILVGWGRQLLWTITLFTIGHSATLTLTALGVISFPVLLVESIIALSIAWAAADVIKSEVGGTKEGILHKRPWLMSGGFGLLHGMGFAGALAEIGLPQQALTISLAAFNIGIEIGQLIIIGLFFSTVFLLLKMGVVFSGRFKSLLCYGIGIAGATWFWQRLLGL